MAQSKIMTSLFGSGSRRPQATRPSPPLLALALAPPPSPLLERPPSSSHILEMPVDIIFYLARHHLPPVSAKALSVSCKRLRAVVPMQNCLPLSDSALEEYLPLLEKDYGGNHYYCHTCRRLHPFDPEMTSALETDPFLPPWDDDRPCLVLNSVQLDGSAVTISFHHIRLVINRHLHKPPAGLPLSIFRLDNPSSPTSTRTPLRWHQSWSARIIDNELFLRCTRTLCSPGAGRVITARAARDAIDDGDYRICKHMAAQWRHTPFVVEALQRPSDEVDEEVGAGDDGLFTPCSEMPESCERCLTDIVTTVECGGDDEEQECRITLTSWHRLGGGGRPGMRGGGCLSPVGMSWVGGLCGMRVGMRMGR